jgi:putative hydrolase of the HAD superfamily
LQHYSRYFKKSVEHKGISGMKRTSSVSPIRTLFLDIGGVLLTDGWAHAARKRAAKAFHLPWADMEKRHRAIFETYEQGKLSLDDYLDLVVFYEKRRFTRKVFRRFMFEQTKPYPEMIDLMGELKKRYGFKIVIVSNEAREINAYRIQKYKIDKLADFFVSSCFVHLRKPDRDIFRLALDLSQTPPQEALYIENTPMFVEIARSVGIRSILHSDYEKTRNKLALLGLEISSQGSLSIPHQGL